MGVREKGWLQEEERTVSEVGRAETQALLKEGGEPVVA